MIRALMVGKMVEHKYLIVAQLGDDIVEEYIAQMSATTEYGEYTCCTFLPSVVHRHLMVWAKTQHGELYTVEVHNSRNAQDNDNPPAIQWYNGVDHYDYVNPAWLEWTQDRLVAPASLQSTTNTFQEPPPTVPPGFETRRRITRKASLHVRPSCTCKADACEERLSPTTQAFTNVSPASDARLLRM